MAGKNKIIKLAPKESIEIKLGKGKIELFLGSKNNKVVIEYLSPWYNFKDKNDSLTKALYVYDPKFYDPKKPTSRARKLLGEDEPLTLGSARNRIYFSDEGKWDDKLAPEHVKIFRLGETLFLENLSGSDVKIVKR